MKITSLSHSHHILSVTSTDRHRVSIEKQEKKMKKKILKLIMQKKSTITHRALLYLFVIIHTLTHTYADTHRYKAHSHPCKAIH